MNVHRIILFFLVISLFFYELYVLKKTNDKTEKRFILTTVIIQIVYLLSCLLGNFIKSKIFIIIEEIVHLFFLILLIGTIFLKCKKYVILLGILTCLITIFTRKIFYNKMKKSGCLFTLSNKKDGSFMKLWDYQLPNVNYNTIYYMVLGINIFYYFTCFN
tara:strand:+ start:194 stop:673 length:480 start_codon:yes stop_codon:yes gene_type:complete